jgi:phosphoglycerate dehydrogenase-like enzyme
VIAAVTDSALDGIRAAAPPGVDVHSLADGLDRAVFVVPGWDDGSALEALARLSSLRVVQALSAGTDSLEPYVPAWATLCSARGARDIMVSEWVVGALLGAVTGQLRVARTRTWEAFRPGELHGMTVLVLGHGSIGRAVEARLAPFGARVIGVASRARDGVHGVDELPALLPLADAVVVLLPLTPHTRGLVDAGVLGRMRDGALLVSAGRGAVVDTDALVTELASGRLRAVLDVTDPEPLPAGHPLWELALAVTPHNAGDSPAADERAIALAAEQLGRFARGDPLENVVRAGDAGSERPR